MIFARFFCTVSVRSQSLDQPLVPGVFLLVLVKYGGKQIFSHGSSPEVGEK